MQVTQRGEKAVVKQRLFSHLLAATILILECSTGVGCHYFLILIEMSFVWYLGK
jgi:hypothetical protein